MIPKVFGTGRQIPCDFLALLLPSRAEIGKKMDCLWGKNGPNRTISGGQTPFSAQVHFLACPWALPLAFLLSFFDCSQRFRSGAADKCSSCSGYFGATSTRTWADRRRLCSGYFGCYIDEGMDRQVSLMFRRLRRLHRRGLWQTGVAYVLATSGATSTRAWTDRRLLCSGYVGGDIDEVVEMTRRHVACHRQAQPQWRKLLARRHSRGHWRTKDLHRPINSFPIV